MTSKSLSLAASLAAMIALMGGPAIAAPCGNNASGFESWKKAFAGEASGNGVGPKAIAALMATKYSVGTIRADRGQKSFKLSLDQFMAKRGGPAIAARGKGMKSANAALFASIEKRFGVPPGPLIAIWGMETAFGSFMGNQPTISAVATLAYDCRRPEYFTDQLYAALQLVDRGVLSGATRGAMHGEVGQTQFLPKSVLLYAVDGDGNGVVNLNSKADALASTANFLKATAKVNSIVSSRRGQLLGFDARPGWTGWDVVEAHIPESEIQNLIVELRSATAGVGTFHAKFDHLAELTGKAADHVLAARGSKAA